MRRGFGLVVIAAVLLAACGASRRLSAAIWCPTRLPTTAKMSTPNWRGAESFDTRTLIGATEAAARKAVQNNGCSFRVVLNNGHSQVDDDDIDSHRVDVDVRNGKVTLVGVF